MAPNYFSIVPQLAIRVSFQVRYPMFKSRDYHPLGTFQIPHMLIKPCRLSNEFVLFACQYSFNMQITNLHCTINYEGLLIPADKEGLVVGAHLFLSGDMFMID